MHTLNKQFSLSKIILVWEIIFRKLENKYISIILFKILKKYVSLLKNFNYSWGRNLKLSRLWFLILKYVYLAKNI